MSLKELLGDELFTQVQEKLGDKKVIIDDGGMIPKSRLDEVIAQRDEARNELKDVQDKIGEFEKLAKGNEELTGKIQTLSTEMTQKEKDFSDRLHKQNLNHALDLALIKNGAKNVRVAKAAFDMTKISLDGSNLLGFDEQLKTVKESDPYLFGETRMVGDEPKPGESPDNSGGKFMGFDSPTELASKDPAKYQEWVQKGRPR